MRHDTLVTELRDAVSRRQALCVAGAGVTMSATGDPIGTSWVGLLKSGLDLCADVARSIVDDDWISQVDALLTGDDALTYLAAAQEIAGKLRTVPGNWFAKWMRDTAGTYQTLHPGLPLSIAELGIPVATTNYDDVLLRVVGGNPITWREPGRFQELLRGTTQGVFHLHGYWRDDTSIILDQDSYATIVADAVAQQHLRAALTGFSVFFVGFGAGLSDPNFLQLRGWIREILAQTNFPPTVLVRESDLAASSSLLHPDGIQVVSFGATHRELEIFLGDLRPRPAPTNRTRTYEWDELRAKLERLYLQIKKQYHPDVVLAVSGAGNFAPLYCMRVDEDETPVLTAVTFPKTAGTSDKNLWFRERADAAGWHHLASTKWDVYLPNLVDHLPVPSRVLIFDDRVIGGNVQRSIAELLRSRGHEVRRAALVVSPQAAPEVDWFVDEVIDEISFPWGGRLGRA